MITLAKINGAEGKQWVGQSTDNKTTVNAESGVNDLFFELDTGIFYYFDGTEWQVIPSGSGGGGTPTVTMDGGWSIASATATVGETSVNKAIPMGGVWCALTEESGTYYYKPFGDTLPAVLGNVLALGYNNAVDSAVDENTRRYILGSSLFIPANETLQTPTAVLAVSGKDSSGYLVYSFYDAYNGVYAEATFAEVSDGDNHQIGLQFVSAAMGTAPGATQDVTALFPMLGAKMLFFCQGVEVVE